jgi:hypothetical protein
MSEERKRIAFFPLNISLLPGEDIPLRIFEPRYKQLIGECELEGKTFGIPYVKDKGMQEYGSEVKLRQIVAKNSKGEMVITIEGVSNFELVSFEDPMPGKLYSGGLVKPLWCDDEITDRSLFQLIIDYTDKLDGDFLSKVKGGTITTADIARALNLSSEDKYKFIASPTRRLREQFLFGQMRYLFKLREQEKLLNNDYYLN